MQITLLRGSDSVLHAFWSAEPANDSLILAPLSHDQRSWAGFRALWEQLLARLPGHCVAAILATQREAASTFLPRLGATIDAAEHPRRHPFELHSTSHLTHNYVLQAPLFEAMAELLGALLMACGASLEVPKIGLLTWEDTALLKVVCRRFPDVVPKLRMGYDPSFTPTADRDGIVWSCSSAKLIEAVENLRAYHSGTTIDLDPPGAPTGHTAEPVAWDILLCRLFREPSALSAASSAPADDPEGWAFARLARSSEPLTSDVSHEIADTVCSTFRRCGFTAALRLGTTLLARCPDLSSRSLAEVHSTVALAAHNRQFSSASGGPLLADFINRHLEAALTLEERPEQRAALLYRAAVTLGRRMSRFAEGLERTDEALTTAARCLEPTSAAYQEAWGLNIRAYLLLRTGSSDASQSVSQTAYARLDAVLKSAPLLAAAPLEEQLSQLDLRATHSLLAHNAYAAAYFAGTSPRSLGTLLDRTSIAAREIPSLALFDAMSWIQHEVALRRQRQALERAEAAVKVARAAANARLDLAYSVRAAELADNLGEAERAASLFADTIDLHRRLAIAPPISLRTRHALALLRMGRIQLAADLLAEIAISGSTPKEIGQQAELLAYRSLTAAHLDDGAGADNLAEKAIDVAVNGSSRAVLLRVAVVLGAACQHLGYSAAALEAYQRARKLAEEADEPPSDDLLAALLGILEIEGFNLGCTLRALRLFPKALRHAGTWWELPRILAFLSQAARSTPVVFDAADLQEPLEAVLDAARQRDDCTSARWAFLEQRPDSREFGVSVAIGPNRPK